MDLQRTTNSQSQEEWLLDFGTSHHMCSHRSWLSSYQSKYDGVVFMDNDISCKMLGLGALRLRCLKIL
jgi:hypothetical protein